MTQKEAMQMIVSILLGAALAIAAVVGWDINPQIITVETPAGPAQPPVVVLPPSEAGKTEVVVVPGGPAPAEGPVLDLSAQSLAGDVTNFSGIEADINSSSVEGLDVDQTGTGDIVVFRDGGSAVWTLADGGTVTYGGGLDLNGQTLTMDPDGDSTWVASVDDIITGTLGAATGFINVATGNLKVGNGTPDTTLNGEDAYVEGTLEVDEAANFDGAVDIAGALTSATGAVTVSDTLNATGAVDFDSTLNVDSDVTLATDLNLTAQTRYTVTMGIPITPTGVFMQIDIVPPAGETGTSDIAAGSNGQLLILENVHATHPITIDGTGGTVECKANVALAPADTLTLVYDTVGAVWRCISTYDNS